MTFFGDDGKNAEEKRLKTAIQIKKEFDVDKETLPKTKLMNTRLYAYIKKHIFRWAQSKMLSQRLTTRVPIKMSYIDDNEWIAKNVCSERSGMCVYLHATD